MRRFATFFKGFAKEFFKIAKVIRKIPNEFRTSNRNASRSLAVIITAHYTYRELSELEQRSWCTKQSPAKTDSNARIQGLSTLQLDDITIVKD